jgi:hypothetical protein
MAIYDKVSVNGDGTFPEDAVELTPEAIMQGLTRALSETVSLPSRGCVPERTRTSDL